MRKRRLEDGDCGCGSAGDEALSGEFQVERKC